MAAMIFKSHGFSLLEIEESGCHDSQSLQRRQMVYPDESPPPKRGERQRKEEEIDAIQNIQRDGPVRTRDATVGRVDPDSQPELRCPGPRAGHQRGVVRPFRSFTSFPSKWRQNRDISRSDQRSGASARQLRRATRQMSVQDEAIRYSKSG